MALGRVSVSEEVWMCVTSEACRASEECVGWMWLSWLRAPRISQSRGVASFRPERDCDLGLGEVTRLEVGSAQVVSRHRTMRYSFQQQAGL